MMQLNPRANDDLYIEERLFRVLEPAIRCDNVFSITPHFSHHMRPVGRNDGRLVGLTDATGGIDRRRASGCAYLARRCAQRECCRAISSSALANRLSSWFL
jgi:hypothetical protein